MHAYLHVCVEWHMYVACTCVSPARVCHMHVCAFALLMHLPSYAMKVLKYHYLIWGLTHWLGTDTLVGE